MLWKTVRTGNKKEEDKVYGAFGNMLRLARELSFNEMESKAIYPDTEGG